MFFQDVATIFRGCGQEMKRVCAKLTKVDKEEEGGSLLTKNWLMSIVNGEFPSENSLPENSYTEYFHPCF